MGLTTCNLVYIVLIHNLSCVDYNCIIISLKRYTVVQEFCDYGNRIYFARATYCFLPSPVGAVENAAKCFKPCNSPTNLIAEQRYFRFRFLEVILSDILKNIQMLVD